jgi:type II secretory pathway component PulF
VNSVFDAMRALDDGRHRAEFYRMWRAGYSAGFAHPKSFETMGPRQSPLTETNRRWLLEGTKQGKGITELTKGGAGGRFEDFERALLAVGEESGSLERALELLGDFYTQKHTLMLWVKKQMAYPFFTMLAACFIAPFPLLWFGRTGAYILTAFGGVALLLLKAGALVLSVAASYGRRPPLARARMARALATAIEAGLPLPRAIRLAGDASANPQIRSYIQRFSERDLATRPISQVLSVCPHMAPDFLAIIKTSERTGDWTPVTRIAELYEDGFR